MTTLDDAPPVSRAVGGRYTMHAEIGRGGLASVHLGTLRGAAGFSRIVAVKCLHPAYARDPEFVTMLVDEARIQSRIRHPNVVPIIDVVAEGGELFLVMDYVHGESLSRLIVLAKRRGERIPPAIASAILGGVLHGLHAAHEALSGDGAPLDLVHRDVSPQNIVAGADGVARILDFGVAKAAGRLQVTRSGLVKGKLGYMAPEQLAGDALDRRTDVYAAGVVLWEALVGERLFVGAGGDVRITAVLGDAVDPPSRRAPELPAALDAVVLRALDRDPAKRWPSALEMALALEAAVPPASIADVSAWVRAVAAEGLAKRAAAIAALERRFVDDATEPLPPESDAAPASAPQPTSSTLVGAPIATSTVTISAIVEAPPPPPARGRSALMAVAVALLLVLGVGVARLAAGPRPTPTAAAPAPPETAAATSPIASSPAPSAEPTPAPAEPPAPSAAASASSAKPTTRTAALTQPARAPSAAPPPVPAPPPARPQTNCDPPFTIDGNGHKHYKKDCLR